MCLEHGSDSRSEEVVSTTNTTTELNEPFPWDIGVFDAHCHPTDTMASIASIPRMKAGALTVMSTRSQDQDLVSDLASEQGVSDTKALLPGQDAIQRVFPAFGWHPWFSYQIYDDTVAVPTYDGTKEGKVRHYDQILSPSPSSKGGAFATGLPDPRPLSDFINDTRSRLEKHSLALVGEVGLDKAFRLPENWANGEDISRDEELTPGGREGRRLSPHRVNMDHQVAIFKAQLRLAGELNRAVSVHGVQLPGGVYSAIADLWKGHEKKVLSRREQKLAAPHAESVSDESDAEGAKNGKDTLKNKDGKPFPPRICLHSYSGPVNILSQYTLKSVPAKVFFSFSSAINFDPEGGDKNKRTEEVIRAVPNDRILVESDLHVAGDRMDQALEDICRKVCKIKNWELRKGVQQLAENYRSFVFE